MKIEKFFDLRNIFRFNKKIQGVVFIRDVFDSGKVKKHWYKIAVKTRNFFLDSYFILKK